MAKKVKKKIKIKWGPFFILCIALICLYGCYEFLISFRITNIYIENNNLLKDQEIIELAQIENYPSFINTTNKNIKERIENSPYVTEAIIKKKFFGVVVIKVKEATALFVNTEGKVVLSNKKEVENNKKLVLATLMNYVPDTKYEELIKQLTKTEEDIRIKVSEIKYEPTERDKDRFYF